MMSFPGGRGGGGQSQSAWKQFKLPATKIKLDFRNANADMVLSMFTKVSGITIIKDPTFKDTLTLTTAKAVSLNDAFEILNAALSVRNFSMSKNGNVLVIQNNNNGRGGGGSNSGFDPSIFMGPNSPFGQQSAKIDLQVYKIKYAAASQVARVVNDVFVQSGNNNPFGGMFGGFGGGAMTFQMGGGRNGGRGGGRGGFNPMSIMGGGNNGQQPNVKASSDDYSNTVIVNAPRDMQSQIAELIDEIDKQTDEPQKAKVYKMQYSDANDLVTVVQNVLSASVPRGRGVNTNQQNQGGGGFFGGLFGGGRNQNTAGGTVTADDRSNTLVVTTTETNQSTVANLLKELDQPVEVKTSTIVVPLVNARADQMATLFRNAFGQRQGVNGGNNTGTTNRTNNSTNTNNTRRTNGGGTGGGTLGLDANGNVTALNLNLDANGNLPTDVDVMDGAEAQMFGGFQQQQNNQRRTGTTGGSTSGRGPDGRLVQVQDLTNQVTVIPDANTNSVIVVTTPENAELIRQIISQLDRIPEQVMIETVIVEASLDAETKLGVEWSMAKKGLLGGSENNTVTSNFGNQTNTAQPQGMRWTIAGTNYSAFLNALKTDTKFNVLSTPRIFTSNNVQAEINISQSIPYVVSTRTDANGNISYNYNYQDVGIVLTVTPRITAGGVVTMDVNQTANDLQGFTSFNAPIINQRQAQTTVSVKDGETIILGGIIRNTVTATTNKIPLLGDLPILGNLFKSKSNKDSKTELMVFLTPKIVRDPSESKQLTQDQAKELSDPTKNQLKRTGKVIGGDNKAVDQGKRLGDGKKPEPQPTGVPVKPPTTPPTTPPVKP